MERCIRAIKKEIEQIDTLCHDWSAWDDLYDFMISPSTDSIKKNLNMDTMVNSHLSLVCINGRTDFTGLGKNILTAWSMENRYRWSIS